MRRVVLLTDFGTADGYAAAMAGVIATAAPSALIEHASHDIQPGHILAGALALSRYARLYPVGTVHLAVVDPGVGSLRRALAATVDDRLFVAPDNGLLTLILRDASNARIVAVEHAGLGDDAAPTFHGRDIFAPAAAHLARAEPLSALGPDVHDPALLPLPQPDRSGTDVHGEILHVDRFGNLISNIPAAWLRSLAGEGVALSVAVDGVKVGPLRRTYTDVETGQPLALIGSLDLLEISVRDGHAGRRLGLRRGAHVAVTMA